MSSLGFRPKVVVVSKHNEEENEFWTVYPTPGFVVKFRDVEFGAKPKALLLNGTVTKFFINLVHCVELPEPAVDLDEDDVAALIDTNKDSFKIPISIGDLQSVEDKKGMHALKIDALINSTYFHKRVMPSEFFRQLTLQIICDLLDSRYGIRLCLSKQVILKNRKFVGELVAQRIRKNPKNSFCSESTSVERDTNDEAGIKPDQVDSEDNGPYEEKFITKQRQVRNFRVQVIGGEFIDVRVRVRDSDGDLICDAERITLKINEDRCVVLLDNARTVADFFLPFRIYPQKSVAKFESKTGSLILKCPIDWNDDE